MWPVRIVLTAVLFVTGTTALAVGCSGSDSHSSRFIYLVPEEPSRPDFILAPFDELGANGVRVVHTFEGLREATGKETRSIIIDRESLLIDGESLSTTDKNWLNRQVANGVLIAGIRINFNELTQVIRTFRTEPWPINFPVDHRFYSYLLHCLQPPDVSEDADQKSLERQPWMDLLTTIDQVMSSVEQQGFQCAGTGVNS